MSITRRETAITKRKAAGLSQRELAKMLGVSQPYIAAFESGKRRWSRAAIDRLIDTIDTYNVETTPEQREKDRASIRNIIDDLHASGWFAQVAP